MGRMRIISNLRRFFSNEHGTAAVETIIMAPFLIVGLVFSYEYYELYRHQSQREKATYTVADILSRETAVIKNHYIDNAKSLFDSMTGDQDDNQLRISVVRYHVDPDQGIDEFELRWSEMRGEGAMNALTQADVQNAHDVFPLMVNGQDLVVVENRSIYEPVVTNGLMRDVPIETRMFMTLRFASQLCYTSVCTP
ncbi:TadE/TadG family type IV pilus assembly protein [Roseovarius sp.]|uniref:TadE/TadG family type IV pilus assembly protein n=1 Tax=Roseovarius sp. TaxID=1486281 RepID=UPI0025FA746B|nr:TadE/TadG family type IV pilus assembly protein [Roseovarius sp.]